MTYHRSEPLRPLSNPLNGEVLSQFMWTTNSEKESCHTWLTLYKIRSVISLEASNDQITNQLYKLMTMQTRVFVAHMPPNLGFRVIQKARDIGMMGEGYVWIFTDGMTNWISSTEHVSSLEKYKCCMFIHFHIKKAISIIRLYSSIFRCVFSKKNH